MDVEVDQETGNVYVYADFRTTPGGEDEVIEYKADGSAVITRFAPQAPSNETVAESPEGVHDESELGPLTINSTGAGGMPKGTVYLADELRGASPYHRLMVFEPESEGDYEHYVYAGEVAAGPGGTGHPPWAPITDEDGNVYVVEERQVGIEEFAPEAPHAYPAPASTPTCKYEFAKGGIVALSVDPRSGEPFFFSYKKEKGFTHKVLHQLGPCEGGKFEETAKVEVTPERDDLYGLAFDPTRALSGRQKGVLYGGAGYGVPQSGVGTGEPGQLALGYVFALPKIEAHPPAIEAEPVAHVTTTTALLRARVNPESFKTRYAFQYETEAEYEANPPGERFAGAAEAPPGGAVAGEGPKAVEVAASLSGLLPDTAYRYRATATNAGCPSEPEELCEVSGEAQSFRTYPAEAPGLPDHRAWELVSPPDKHGGQVLSADPRVFSCAYECKPNPLYTHFPMQSAPDGNAVAYEGTAFATEGGAAVENEYLARRDPTKGWQSTNLSPALLQKGSGSFQALSTDLSRALLAQHSPALAPGAPAGYEDLYSQPTADPFALTPLLTQAPPHRPASGSTPFEVLYAGASADLSRVFLAANDSLTAEVPGVAPAAPEVTVPAGKSCTSAPCDLYEWHEGQLSLVSVLPGNASAEAASFPAGSAHRISADGSRAFFSAPSGQVFVREDGRRTLEVHDPGHFLSASADGSQVLLDDGCLYSLASEECTDLTQGKGGFEGLLGQSEGLSHAYFVDTEVLSGAEESCRAGADEAQVCEAAEEGKHNLYAWARGQGTRFIAQLASADNGPPGGRDSSSDWNPASSDRTAEASPGGRYLAFLSKAPLTGFDNLGLCEGAQRQFSPCPEAFLYDSATGRLTCASCDRSGEPPLGWSALRLIDGPTFLPQPRYLTDSGRLYFDSEDSLVPADTNEGVEDVYQYELQGAGTCGLPEGCVSLLSAGTGTVDSNFLAADESGANVFFTTRDQLTLKDSDELIDLYDAREGGGIAAESESQRSECQGEACQPAFSPPPELTPGTTSVEGGGNISQASERKGCPKGKKQLRRPGKASCVKPQRNHKRKRHARANRRAHR